MKANLNGLRQQLRKFNENGKYVSGKNWTIVLGGYDLYFQILYNGVPVLDCIENELRSCLPGIENYWDIEDIVLQEYKDTRRYEIPAF